MAGGVSVWGRCWQLPMAQSSGEAEPRERSPVPLRVLLFPAYVYPLLFLSSVTAPNAHLI